MKLNRRSALALFCSLGFTGLACAQQNIFSDHRPVKIIAPFAPGGTGDALSRLLAERLGIMWGVPIIVENRQGGSAIVATQALVNAPADGHTLLVSASNFTINPALFSKLPYDSTKDFAPLTLLAANPHVLIVNPSVPAKNLQAFIAWARTKNGSATYGSFGNGTSGHLGFERFMRAAGIEMIHVPYKGAAPAISDLLGGQIDAMFSDTQQVIQYLPSGKIRAIASASAARPSSLPEVPTFAEGGLPGFASTSWFGLIVKAGTPPSMQADIHRDVLKVLGQTDVKARLQAMGVEPGGSAQKDFEAFLLKNAKEYGDIVRSAGIRIE